MKRAALVALLLLVGFDARAQVVSRTVGALTMTADLSQAWPGGVIVARLRSRSRISTTYAILDGRRALFYPSSGGPRAFVPIPADAEAGPTQLGIEMFTRRGRQRIPLSIEIAPRDYAPRDVTIPETRRHLPSRPGVVTQARQFLLLVRTESREAAWRGGFQPPIDVVPSPTFGGLQSWIGAPSVEPLTDGLFGERGRGLDYEVPVGTLVQSPAAGTVLFAGAHEILGRAVAIDHGQGVVSVLAYLSRTDVMVGDHVESRTPLGLSGDSGIANGPLVEWRVYLHGIPVDPRVFGGGLD